MCPDPPAYYVRLSIQDDNDRDRMQMFWGYCGTQTSAKRLGRRDGYGPNDAKYHP